MKTSGFWAGCLTLILTAGAYCWLGLDAPTEAERSQASPPEPETLSAADKAELAEILRLKTELGDYVWPGLSRIDIPLILYNERFEFLVGEANPPSPWQPVREDDFLGRAYFRRRAENPESFAVAVGTRWAGSLGTLDLMNAQTPIRFSREFHVVLMLHEVFHAFQATLAPEHFMRARSVYKLEKDYPHEDPEFSTAWNREGEALADALRAKEETAIFGLARKFLGIREARRGQSRLHPELISYERELEWLDGLGKYAEVRFSELSKARASEPAYANYRTGHPFWPADLGRLRINLGGQKEDLRFYLSGVAQALLLDRLSPSWKSTTIGEITSLEDLLRAVLLPD
jgi:hypothetical protein